MIALLAGIVLFLLAGGIWFINQHNKREHQKAEAHLLAIARLKASQINKWRQERVADAAVLQEQGSLAAKATRFFRHPSDALAADIKKLLQPVKDHYHFYDILLIDPGNRVRLSLIRQAPPQLHESYIKVINKAAAERKPAWMDFHVGTDYAFPHISVAAPLFSGADEQNFIGTVFLVCDARQFLFPLIQSWPTLSRTAETLFVRQDGADVLFLNELRHRKNTALQLRIPLSRTDLPAALAIAGRQGVVEGPDYRGENVLAAILPVPDSPWFIVAKTDTAEIFAQRRFQAVLLLGFLLICAGLITAIGLVLRQRYLKRFYKEHYHSETTLNQTLRQHHITLQSIGDAVIVTDGDGRITMLNPVAEQLTGWKTEEAFGQMINHVFHIINEQTREKVEPPIKQVLDKGVIVGLANHTLLISKDGRKIPIADSAAPILGNDNQVTGVVLVFRDQTAELDQQNRLSDNERKYRLLSDNSLDVIWTMDLDFKFTYVNPAIETLTGFSPEEWIGSRLSKHCEDKSLTAMTRIINEATAREPDGSGFIFEDAVLNNRGEPVPVEIHGRVIYDDNDQPVSIQGVTRNISERKRAEEDLRHKQQLLQRIGNIAKIGGWEVDLKTRQVVWTDQTYAIHEVPPDYQPTLEKAITFFHPDDAPRLEAALKAAMKNGDPYDLEVRFITAKGRELWTQAKCFPIKEDGTVTKLTGTFQDVSEKKALSEELYTTAHSLQLALKSSHIGLFDWNMDSGNVFFSPEWKSQIGFADNEIESRYEEWESRIHPEDRDHVHSVLDAYLENTDKEYRVQFRFRHKDGSYRHILALGEALLDENGRPFRMTGCHLDITDQIQAEAQKQELESKLLQARKMESIGRLAGGVAHDLNNMLTPIIGYTEMLAMNQALDEETLEIMHEIHEAADRARSLVRQLLAFSRRQPLEMKTINLNQTILDMEKLLNKTIRENIRINLDLAEDLSPILADRGQLEQVIMNLAINAQDAMPEGGLLDIEIKNMQLDENHISSGMIIKPGPYVLLSISDTGIGMDEETRKNLFEPFYTTKETGKSTGLGLATVYGIVKQHHGDIWVYSEPGKGSTFKLYFPARPDEVISDSTPLPSKKDNRGTETILIAEDDEMVRKITVKILRSKGYKTFSMATCEETLTFLQGHKGPLDLLLTDVIMPEMNGRELYEQVAAIFPDINVLYMSGYTDNVIAHHGVLEKDIDFIQKPFTVSGLSAKVREVLDRQ